MTDWTIEELKKELTKREISFHPACGKDTLLAKLNENVAHEQADTTIINSILSAPITEQAANVAIQHRTKNSNKITKMSKKEREALKLIRIKVTPVTTEFSDYKGLIFTVGSSEVNKGKMIKRFVPFNNENGWHVEKIIYDAIIAAKCQKFKKVRTANGEEIAMPYITNKFNVTVLPYLTPEEMKVLASNQSRGM